MAESSTGRWIGIAVGVVVALLLGSGLCCVGSLGGLWGAFFAGIYTPPAPQDRPLVIRGGTFYDGFSERAHTGWIVVIEGDRITCAGKDCGAPAHAEVLEAKGRFVAPGLIDLHVHMGAPTGADAMQAVPFVIWSTLRHRPAVRQALLESGITTVRSVGDDLMATQNQRIWLAEGTLGGPQLFGAGPVFTAPGGHPANQLLEVAPWMVDGSTRQVDDPDRARTRVNEVVDSEMQGIKAVYDGVNGIAPKLDPLVMKAVVEEGRSRQVWVAVHTGTDQDVREAGAAGATTIEHGARDALTEETIEVLLESGAVYVPTLAVTRALLPTVYEQVAANVLSAHQAGIPIGVGSDTQGPDMAFGRSTLEELQLLVEAGLTPLEALAAATSTAARALGMEGELGALSAGARADLVLFDGNPVEDPAVLARPVGVIQAGRVVRWP